jgi:hypothetical protein
MAAGELARTEAESAPAEHPNAAGDGRGPVPAVPEHGGEAETTREDELPVGSVLTASGRVSAATEFRADEPPTSPFSGVQLSRLDEALTLVSRHTRLRFSIYLGDLGEDSHAGALRLHDQLGSAGADSVLVAVDPRRRNVDIVTGSAARVRLADRGCKLAVMSMIASFKEGDLLGGLLSGLRMLSDQAGEPHH